MKRVVWVVPEESKGGIQSYSESLWPHVKARCEKEQILALDPLYCSLVTQSELDKNVDLLKEVNPDLIHIQHEYGLFGAKIPGFYSFPSWVRKVRQALPRAKLIATAHTVLNPDYRYPLKGRGWQIPLRWIANQTLMGSLHRKWGNKTWGILDGVIVHSRVQEKIAIESGCRSVAEIPHFVPQVPGDLWTFDSSKHEKTLMIFGFLTPEKGQDIVIRALAELPENIKLVIAGGVRRKADEVYHRECRNLIAKTGLQKRVTITGFLSNEEMGRRFADADLVIAPFRETAGSGSLVQGLSRGCPILASDLALNREIADREPGCLAFFRNDDASDCASQISALLGSSERLKELSTRALAYSRKFGLAKTAETHRQYYGKLYSEILD